MGRSTDKPTPEGVLKNIRDLLQDKHQYQTISQGEMFGRYKIQYELGRGGMGVVYKALDTKLNMTVALKVIMAKKKLDSLERFKREASATAKLDHPNIIRFYEVGESPQPYFTMEYVEGYTLAYLIKEKKIKHLWLIDIMTKLCDALAYAHHNKILHRDIKPSNIMLNKEGIPKIMDFGSAKITNESMQNLSQSGQAIGTMHYMAPEHVNGKATYKSDIYSLGATLYEALTYKTVFQGDTHFNLIYQILEDHPILPRKLNPDISPYVEAICLKCLNKNQKKRYIDFKQLSREFKNLRNHKPILAKEYTQWDTFKNFANKYKVLCISISLALVVFIGSFVIILNKNKIIHDEKVKADKAYKKLKLEQNKVKSSNEKLTIEKQKADNANEDLQALNNAIIKSLGYAKRNKKYKGLFADREFLDPVIKVFRQSTRLQIAQEYRPLRGIILGESSKEQDILQAIDDFNREIQKNPQDVLAYTNRGAFYYKLGKYNLAEKDHNKAISLNPNFSLAYSNRGSCYDKQGKYNLAKKDYDKAIFLNPKFAEAFRNRGAFYYKQGKYNLAERDLSIAISLDPKYALAYSNRGLLYENQGKYNLAERDLNKAISLNPILMIAYNNRGRLYYRQGKYKLAIIDWEKTIDLGYSRDILQPYINQARQFIKRQK